MQEINLNLFVARLPTSVIGLKLLFCLKVLEFFFHSICENYSMRNSFESPEILEWQPLLKISQMNSLFP